MHLLQQQTASGNALTQIKMAQWLSTYIYAGSGHLFYLTNSPQTECWKAKTIITSNGEDHMSKKAAEHHKKASEHLTHAARHHGEAAKHHEAGSHEKAAHHAHVARGHAIHARGYAEEAVKAHLEEHGKK